MLIDGPCHSPFSGEVVISSGQFDSRIFSLYHFAVLERILIFYLFLYCSKLLYICSLFLTEFKLLRLSWGKSMWKCLGNLMHCECVLFFIVFAPSLGLFNLALLKKSCSFVSISFFEPFKKSWYLHSHKIFIAFSRAPSVF